MFIERDRLLTAGRVQPSIAGRFEERLMALAESVAVPSGTDRDETIAEARQLIEDLRDAAQDGRDLARRYADVLTKVVDEYCTEFQQRAEAALARLEADR